MSDSVDKLLELSRADLHRWRKRRKGRGKYNRRNRPEFTKEQLAEYLKKKNFRTREQLRRGREEGEPTDADYREAYGSFRAAREEIWQVEPWNREYVVKALIEFNLWTREKYHEARRNRPDVLPPLNWIVSEFGSWSTLKEIATAFSLRRTIDAYVVLRNRLGRRPTLKEAKMAGIILDKAVKIYGGKPGFDKFIESLESVS